MVIFGNVLEVEGNWFCIRSKNIIVVSRIVVWKVIFFLDMDGRVNLIKEMIVMMKKGIIMVVMKKIGRFFILIV